MTKHTVLILASETDQHALVVGEALTHVGIRHHLLSHRDFPQHQSICLGLDEHSDTSLVVTRKSDLINFKEIDTIWFRRELSAVPHNSLDNLDRDFVTKQCEVVLSGIETASTHARWINPRNAALVAENKILQLHNANKLGLKIPPTLISNNPDNIQAFVKRHPTIYKPLSGFVWRNKDNSKATYTREINLEDLKNRISLQQCPSIFQALIRPEYEVRMLLLGNKALAIKINTEIEHPTVRDWRFMQNTNVKSAPIEVPEDIYIKCMKLLKSMQLETASFDFIVDKKGIWYFLELNQAGQFLFLEKWCPDLPVLAAFCSFLNVKSDCKMQQQSYADIKLTQFNQHLK